MEGFKVALIAVCSFLQRARLCKQPQRARSPITNVVLGREPENNRTEERKSAFYFGSFCSFHAQESKVKHALRNLLDNTRNPKPGGGRVLHPPSEI